MTIHLIEPPQPADRARTLPPVIALISTAAMILSMITALTIAAGDGTTDERGGPRSTAVPLAPAAASVRVSVLLVGSSEQAIELQRNAAQLSADGVGPGVVIVVAGSADEVRQARETVGALRQERGAAGVHVVDLRGSGALPLTALTDSTKPRHGAGATSGRERTCGDEAPVPAAERVC
jgi:hypothetical protein